MPLINLITIIFVAVSGYFLVIRNPNVSDALHQYYDQAKTEFQKLEEKGPGFFSSLHIGELPSFSSPFDTAVTDTNTDTKAKPIPASSLPGPLVKMAPTKSAVPTSSSLVSAGSLTVKGIISATNAHRIADGKGSLTESAKLDASAEVKARDMLARQYFEHTAPDGKTVSDLVGAQGYAYIKIGENLALGDFKDDADVVTAWMNSPGHRANILDAAYTEIGVGVAYGMYEGRLVSVSVQHFGKPLNSCPIIDASLKERVEKGQADLEALSRYLESLKKSIDEGRARGENMDSTVDIYNQGVEKYQKDFKIVDADRVEYNKEVAAFNACAVVR